MSKKQYSYNRFSGVGNFDGRRIDGVANFPGGEFAELKVSGVATSDGTLIVEGALEVDGVMTVHGNVECGTLDTDGVMTVHGNTRASSIDIDGAVTISGKVEADRIVCDGALSTHDQVSADVIDASGFINARELVGDRITIQSHKKNFIFQAWLKLKSLVGSEDHSKVDLIEATTINLRGVHAHTVSGHDVCIGPGCIIDRVDASGQLFIDPLAQIGEVVGQSEPQAQASGS